MDIKARLKQYRTIKREWEQIGRQLEELEANLYDPKPPRLTGLPASSTGDDPRDGMIDQREELRKLYTAKERELAAEQLAIEKAIDSLDPVARLLLRSLYIEGMAWKDVGAVIHYSRAQANRIHDKALERLERENALQ